MGSNVFGNPVTDEMVRDLFPNVTTITARHRAEAALMHFNADEKATNVRRFVHNLKESYGIGTSALGMIYNGTGAWSSRDWLLAWDITPRRSMNIQNRVYTQIGDSISSVPSWESIDAAMGGQTGTHHFTSMFRCYVIASTGAGSSPEFVGTMSLASQGYSASAVATNLFGTPVTDDTARLVFPNLTTITARERAQVALLHMNADEKATNVRRFVHELKAAYGSGTSTLGMIYNATGRDLIFHRNHTWGSGGNAWRTPYPRVIRNGQWAGFLHVGDGLLGPSKEAILYRGGFMVGDPFWMLAWNITPRINNQNRVYTEINTGPGWDWNTIDAAMESLTHSSSALGFFSTVSTGTGSSPELVGIMSLDGLGPNFMAMASDVSVISHSLDSKYDGDVVVQGREADIDNPARARAPAPAPAE